MGKVSIITDKKSRLAKKFSLSIDGELLKSTAEQVVDGEIETVTRSLTELRGTICSLNQNQCLCLGHTVVPGVQTIKSAATAGPNDITRSKEHLKFSSAIGNLFLMLDFDDSGLTPVEALDVLAGIDPQFKTAGVLVVPSSSAYIFDKDDNQLTGAGNYHLFTEIKGNPEEYCRLLFNWLIIKGHGKPFITKAGSVVIKSLFDVVATSPERVIYEVNPVLEDGLVSKRLEHIEMQDGPAIDASKLRALSSADDLDLRLALSDLRNEAQDEALTQRRRYNEVRAQRKAKANGTSVAMEMVSMSSAAPAYDKLGRPILELASDEIILDESGNEMFVRDILVNPVDGMKLPDPWEPFIRGDEAKGIPGRGIATVLGVNIIYSHAHCGMINIMRWTVSDLINIFTQGLIEERKTVWKMISSGMQELVQNADLADISELADAIKNGLKTAGGSKEKRHIAAKLKPSTAEQKDVEDETILRMNAKYGMAIIQGKTSILYEEYNPSGEIFETVFSTPISLDTLHKNELVKVPANLGGEMSSYRYWERSVDRNTFTSVMFSPNAHTFRSPGAARTLQQGGVYNMFQGYLMDPAKATSCGLIKKHIREVWCGDKPEEYVYVMAWLAHLFQHPEEVSTTSLVLQSEQGVGKNIIIDGIIVKTLGVHALSTANQEDIVGRFNAHLGMNVFVYANEMAYTAQTSVKSALKTLLTDEHRMIEAKGINKIKARNCTSVIFGSNDSWILSIEADDRRYVYLSVDPKYKGKQRYFKNLYNEIHTGGREAFVLELLNHDYSEIDLTVIPNQNQKQKKIDRMRSAHPVIRFFYSLVDADNDLTPYEQNVMSRPKLERWRKTGGDLQIGKMQFFDLFRNYCDYFTVSRNYDDADSIMVQLEAGGLMPKGHTNDDPDMYPITFVSVGKSHRVLVIKEIPTCRKLMGMD